MVTGRFRDGCFDCMLELKVWNSHEELKLSVVDAIHLITVELAGSFQCVIFIFFIMDSENRRFE